MRELLARLSVRNWSLRARLVGAVVGLVAVALATGTVGTTLPRSYLVRQVDEQFAVGVAAMTRGPALRPSPPAIAPGDQLPTPFSFTDLDPDGNVLDSATADSPGFIVVINIDSALKSK